MMELDHGAMNCSRGLQKSSLLKGLNPLCSSTVSPGLLAWLLWQEIASGHSLMFMPGNEHQEKDCMTQFACAF